MIVLIKFVTYEDISELNPKSNQNLVLIVHYIKVNACLLSLKVTDESCELFTLW